MAKKPQREKVNEFTKTYHWFFCDIVSSANPAIPTIQQREKIKKFYDMISKIPITQKKDPNRIIVPTGDGYVIGFSDSYDKPVRLAIDLLKNVTKYNQTKKIKEKLNLRIGIDTGPVYEIKDSLTKNNAFWGPGIIMAKRVMDLAGENQIFASKDIAEKMKNLSKEYRNLFHPIGKYQIKHNEQVQIYNIYGKDFGNKSVPKKSKIIKKKETPEDKLAKRTIKFWNIDIFLKVLDPKTMLTNHTWIWDVQNITSEPRTRLHYNIGGDIPKDFADLNVKATDSKGRKLKIVNIGEDDPTQKIFDVELINPLTPRSRLRNLRMEYDWEEPKRFFEYKPLTDCQFSYQLTVPKEVKGKKIRILIVDYDLGEKHIAEPGPEVIPGKKETKIIWKTKNAKKDFFYRLEW